MINVVSVSVVSIMVFAFAGDCRATGEVLSYSKLSDIVDKLKGRWSPDCKNLEGIKIDGHLKAEFTINSNQIVINSFLREDAKEKGIFSIYFESPLDLGRGGMNLDWDGLSKFKRVAVIKIKSKNNVILNWTGFCSNKTKAYIWTNDPDFYGNNGKIDFHRCEN
jgi:hypothetical protein